MRLSSKIIAGTKWELKSDNFGVPNCFMAFSIFHDKASHTAITVVAHK